MTAPSTSPSHPEGAGSVKLTGEILAVLAASPDTHFDAADVLTRLEEGGREYRLAHVFNALLDLKAAGSIAVAEKAGNRTLYRALSKPHP